MKVSMTVSLVSSLVLMFGCKAEHHMTYDGQSGKVIPIVKPGDTIKWDVSVKFAATGNPCEGQGGPTRDCVVKSAANKHTFGYECDKIDCDPEIAVDDDKNMNNPKAAATGATRFTTPRLIYLACSSDNASGMTIVDPSNEEKAAIGDTIAWKTNGDHELVNWAVTLQGDYKDKLCDGGKYEFRVYDQCKLLKLDGATSVEYIVKSDNCMASSPARVTPR